MVTKEELLRGVVRVNNEKQQREDSSARVDSEVQANDDKRGVAAPGYDRGGTVPEASDVPTSKESIHKFVERRASELVEEMEELTDELTEAESRLSRINDKRREVKAELKMLGKISAGFTSL